MTLQQIHYAITVAESGSMNKAAEILYITQPSLTSSIKALENETGISIFFRTGKGVTLTSEGIDFLQYARQVYQHYEILQQRYSDKANIKRKFGVSTQHYSFAVQAFVETVKQFGTLKYEFALRETKTLEVINDVGTLKSEIGILYLSDYNSRIIKKLLKENGLIFNKLVDCSAYVYLHKDHPLAKEESIGLEQLEDYSCLSFEQGDRSSFYLSEEILSDIEYPRTIKTNDRATMLNLMKGLHGYTLCSGIISEDLNSSDYLTVPFREDEENRNTIMTIGYIVKDGSLLSQIAEVYISQLKDYLKI
ncbi:MAG: LysR family transcriptional regulator [Clostridia bacterium]|nr:LysR family transcriptional regulator [Clostridia bacterium]